MAEKLVTWNAPEGIKRLAESKYCRHFYTLAHLFERQIKPTHCGIASAVMVLNALRLRKAGLTLETKLDLHVPNEAGGGKVAFNCYSQLTFLDTKTDKIKSRKNVEGKASCDTRGFDPGLQLDDLAKKLRLHLLDVKVVLAESHTEPCIDRFRKDLMAFLTDSSTFIIANFDSSPIGREGGGHFSPIAAYHPETDSCLVMDVAGCASMIYTRRCT